MVAGAHDLADADGGEAQRAEATGMRGGIAAGHGEASGAAAEDALSPACSEANYLV